MKKLVQINTTANWGSTGRIAEGIGEIAMESGWDSLIVYGRYSNPSRSKLLRVGSDSDIRYHGIMTRLFDRHGLESANATRRLIPELEKFAPDIIHLHNIHGYYLNYPILFDWLKRAGIPVVWTLHDCWSFTGHCAHFDAYGCYRWKKRCHNCPLIHVYPASLFFDGSQRNFRLKKEFFLGLENLTLVPVSDWLSNLLGDSILRDYPRSTIHNGIDLSVFRPSEKNISRSLSLISRNGNIESGQHILLGVASVWDERKGLDDLCRLRKYLPEKYRIILVGLSPKQINRLPSGIEGISRTENIEELRRLYSESDLLINPTYEDTFPTVNLEALACGTPVVTYNTGGSPEAIDSLTGRVVPKGDIMELSRTIIDLTENNRLSSENCRQHAEELFDSKRAFRRYIDLYENIISRR